MSSGKMSGILPNQGRARGISRAFLPLIVLASTVSGTLLFWNDANERATENAQHALERRVSQSVDLLRDRFTECKKVLKMGRVLIDCSENVSREEWRRFVDSLDLSQTLPGVNGIAYVRVVPDGELTAFIEEVGATVWPDFQRRAPEGGDNPHTLDAYYLIQYHEPSLLNTPHGGLDVAADPDHRMAYDMAMATGAMRMTSVLQLSRDGEEPRRWLGLALPVYEGGSTPPTPALRRDRIRGWVAMSIDVETFLSDWWSQAGMDAGYVITERGSSGSELVLHSQVGLGGELSGPSVLEMPLSIGGRSWELGIFRTSPLEVDNTTASMTVLLGLVISLLISGIMWSMTFTRHRAVQLAEKMTTHLRESEKRQRRLAEDAGQANRMKSLFLANMSHDVRTPMTAILGYTRLLEQELGDQTTPLTSEALVAIRRSGDHLLGLINDVLDLSKIEAGRLELVSEPIVTAELIASCIGIVRQTAEAKRIELRAELRTPIPATISGDLTRLRQIALNLLGNAVKFTDCGSVSFTAWAEGENLGVLCFEVRDTGIGMNAAELQRVFDSFVQADASHTRTYGGTGLGLTIARHLVEQMGGVIEADSTPGVGSSFVVRLPVERLDDETITTLPETAGVVAPEDAHGPDEGERSTGRVLVAEDGPDNQRLISHILGRAGYDFDIVDNGRSALDAIEHADSRSRPYDVILLDMQLPELDGYGVARELRVRGHAGSVIALTAHAMTGDREKCLAAGCDGYISKPFDQKDLIETVDRAVERARAA